MKYNGEIGFDPISPPFLRIVNFLIEIYAAR